PRVLRQVPGLHAGRSHPQRHPVRRPDHAARPRARPGEGRLPGRPAAGGRRPAGQPGDPARSEAAAGGDEGRPVREGAPDRLVAQPAPCGMRRHQKIALWLLVGGPLLVFSLWAVLDNSRLYFVTLLNGLTLGSLYFIVASGFTLVFGLMRNVNLAHGSLYLLG